MEDYLGFIEITEEQMKKDFEMSFKLQNDLIGLLVDHINPPFTSVIEEEKTSGFVVYNTLLPIFYNVTKIYVFVENGVIVMALYDVDNRRINDIPGFMADTLNGLDIGDQFRTIVYYLQL